MIKQSTREITAAELLPGSQVFHAFGIATVTKVSLRGKTVSIYLAGREKPVVSQRDYVYEVVSE